MLPFAATNRHGWLLVPAGLLFTAWSLVVPIFEAPDEPAHWQYARHLHDHWSLPLYKQGFEEANSPPLYYLAIAPFAKEAGSPPIITSIGVDGQPVSLAPPRTFLNTDADFSRYWPIRIGRLVSILMSVGTVWLSFLAGRTATSRTDTGLLAALLVALLPQFAFRGSQVSNDALVILLAAATTHGVVTLVRLGFTWSRGVWTGVALAGAYLSKISAIALGPPVVLAVVAAAPRVPWRSRAVRLAVLGVALLLVLPWSLRNVWLYGDPFASGAMRTAVGHIITERSLFSGYFALHFPIVLFKSFVGFFGWASLPLPGKVYGCFLVLGAAAAAGLARAVWIDRSRRPLVLVLAVAALGALAVVVHINLSFTQPQGRYMFPALPAMAILSALGLQALPRGLSWIGKPMVLGPVLTSLNLYALLGIVLPAYYPPLTRDVGPGVRQIHPALVSELAFSPASGEFVITGTAPWMLMAVDVRASDFDTLTVRMRATLPTIPRTGCVAFVTVPASPATTSPLCFGWRADGTSQVVRLDLAAYKPWMGHVTHLRVDPLQAGGEDVRGARLIVEPLQLERRGHPQARTDQRFRRP